MHAHIPLRLTAPTKPQCILGTIKETRDHRSGQRTQTEGERRRVRGIEMDDREGERNEVKQRQIQETIIFLYCFIMTAMYIL